MMNGGRDRVSVYIIPTYSAITLSIKKSKPNISRISEVIVPNPGKGTPRKTACRAPNPMLMNDNTDNTIPITGMIFSGFNELASTPRIAKPAVTNGLKEDVPPTRGWRS